MKNVIIAIDFSETSLNAARYAAAMLRGQSAANIILYNMFDKMDEAEVATEYLESLKKEFKEKGVPNVEIIRERGTHLVECLDRLAFQKAATLIVLGINGKRSAISLTLVGSNPLRLAEKNICPVLIIPPDAKFNSVDNIAFTCDFKDVDAMPLLFIKSMLDFFKAKPHVINVNSEHYISVNEHYTKAEDKINQMFQGYDPDYYFMHWHSLHEAINQFAEDNSIDMLLVIPKYHSFISRTLNHSHTKELVYHSTVPILVIHE